MYNQSSPQVRSHAEPVPEQPDHLSVAANFTEEIMSRFNEFEVNEIIFQIKGLITSARQNQVEELSYRLKHLEGSLEQLNGAKLMRP